MEKQQNNSSLKVVIIVLSLLLAGSLGWMYKMSTESKTKEVKLMSEKDQLLADLKAQKESYDQAIEENTGLKGDLEAERAKIVELIAKVEKSDGNAASMAKFKTLYVKLKREHDALIAENNKLKEENGVLTTQRDSTRSALTESKRYNDTLTAQNSNLSQKVEKAQKLTITNLTTKTFKKRSSGKLIETDKARRVDQIDIAFTIAGNEVAIAGDKTYYVQVIDPKNNVIGDKKVESFDGQTLTYSFVTTAKYENKTMDVKQSLMGQDFEKGLYQVNVFDKGTLVSNSSFTLR
ncbi:hypothetical protein ACLI08_09160 [Flavobacterium sp. RNTU_13]|jgi:hypothetical protein|uniref:hypothetical protein n=1 Tax=Flavobacterium sp. RNTU_13 TaxID=3375145 RepID=UPI00398841DF